MRRSFVFFGGLGLIVATIAIVIFQQRQTAAVLRADLDRRHDEQREAARLKDDNQRRRVIEISPAQLEALRNDHAALEQIRADVDAARMRAEKATSVASSSTAVLPSLKRQMPTMAEEMVPVEMWRNAGAATPMATMETLLWAAAGGDVALVAQSLNLSDEARAKAVDLFARLPDSLRGQFSSPEQLIASLAVKDVPLGSARLVDPKVGNGKDVTLLAILVGPDKKTQNAYFSLRPEGERWKLVVPTSAVEKYAAMLNPSVSNAAK